MPPVILRSALLLVGLVVGASPSLFAQQIRGRVLESETLQPVPSATVSLLDTEMVVQTRARADDAGTFQFDDLAPGVYLLQAQAGGRFSSISAPVDAEAPGDSVLLVVPSIVFELSGSCTVMSESMTVLAGIVYDDRTGVPLPGARVTAHWAGGPVEALASTTDPSGRYRFCGVPVDRPVELRLSALGRTSAVMVEVPDVQLARADLGLDLEIGASSLVVIATRPLGSAAATGEVAGIVLDAEGRQPLGDVVIRAAGGRSTAVSGDDGRFHLTGLADGEVVLEVEHLAFGTHRELISMQRGVAVDVELLLAARPVALDALEVRGRSAPMVSARTSATRFDGFSGTVLAAAESRGERVLELVRTLPGITVMEGMFTTRYGVTNGACLTTPRRLGTLRSGGVGSPTAPWCDPIPIYVDDVPVADGIAFLRSLNVADYESIELLSPTDAQVRYGMAAGAAGGALVLWTRGRGPFVSQSRNTPPR